MTGRTHNAAAFAALVTAAAFFPPENLNVLTLAGCVVATSIGALFPDMDQAGNDLWNLLPASNSLGRVMRRIFYKHRTLTHSFVGVYLVYRGLDYLLPKFLNPAFVNPELIMWAFIVGMLSHFVTDALTEEGLPLLFPINLNFGFPPIRSWRIKTGYWFENFIIFPGIWIYLVWFIHEKREVFVKILKQVSS